MSCLLLSDPQDCLANSTGLCDALAPLKTQHIGVPLSVPSTYPEKALHLIWVLKFTIKISFSTSLHDSLLPLTTEHFACSPITIPFITDKHHLCACLDWYRAFCPQSMVKSKTLKSLRGKWPCQIYEFILFNCSDFFSVRNTWQQSNETVVN